MATTRNRRSAAAAAVLADAGVPAADAAAWAVPGAAVSAADSAEGAAASAAVRADAAASWRAGRARWRWWSRGRGRNMNAFGNGRRNADALQRESGDRRGQLGAQCAAILAHRAGHARPSTQNARINAMFGGPLKIPHLISGQKTNFTVNYQFTRARTGNTVTTLLPTAAEGAGDFSPGATCRAAGDHLRSGDRAPFAGNIIPQSRFSPQAVGLLASTRCPNFTNNQRYNYQTAILGATIRTTSTRASATR